MTGTVAAVVLAAGQSSRLGWPKQLLDLGGVPLVTRVVRTAFAAGLSDVIVVTGAAADRVETAVAALHPAIAFNPRFAEGQSTSLAVGIAAVPEDADAAIVLLGDQPGVDPAVIRAVVAAFRESGAAIVAPVYGKILGNPVLFRRDLFPDLRALTGDEGARALIRSRMADVHRVPVPGDAPPPDIDTEADYQAAVAAMERG
ncbi:MAG: nucleotidyltransferase family protein [Thermomicrobiales bacterium]